MDENTSYALDSVRRQIVEGGRELARLIHQQRLAFLRHQAQPLEEAESLRRDAASNLTRARESLADTFRDSRKPEILQLARSLAEAAYSFEVIASTQEKIGEGIARKIKERVVFSDPAVQGVRDLLRRTSVQVLDASDALATFNPRLRLLVLDGCDSLSGLVDRLAGENEQRKAQGVCSAPASEIFVGILGGVRDICEHVRNIASLCPAEETEP